MSANRRVHSDPTLTCVVRPRGEGSFDALLLRHAEGAGAIVVERRRIAAEAIGSWLSASNPATRLVLLPASATICRLYRLPSNLPLDQTRQALMLQAESHLLGGVPPHRTSVGLLPRQEGGGMVGVLLAWSEKSMVEVPPGSGWRVVPEPLALLSIGASDGAPRLLAFADERDGSIALHLRLADRLLLRATCETPDAGEDWDRAVRRAVAETALAAGVDGVETTRLSEQVGSRSTRADGVLAVGLDEARPEFAGLGADDPIGRLLAASARAATGDLRELVTITPQAPVEAKPAIQQAIDSAIATITSPSGAIRVAVVAILLAALVPIAAAGVRVAILRAKLPDPEAFEQSMRQSEQQLAVYRELEEQAWPMMKILGDLSNCMPEAIEVDSIVVGHGEPVTIKGTAKPEGAASGADAILEMERRMRATQIFDKITKRWDPPDARGVYEFIISADVARPTSRTRFAEAEDFAAKSLAERRYGPSARPGGATKDEAGPAVDSPADLPAAPPEVVATAPDGSSGEVAGIPLVPPTAAAPAGEESPSASTTPERGIGRRKPNPEAGGSGGGRAVEVPQWSEAVSAVSLTDDEIESLSKAEAQAALGRVSRARQSPGLDDDAKARLKDLFDKLLRRVREAP